MDQGEVDSYVYQYLQQGYSADQVRQWASAYGATEEQLAVCSWLSAGASQQSYSYYASYATAPAYCATASERPPIPPPPPHERHDSGLSMNTVLGVVLAVVVVVAGGGYLYAHQQGLLRSDVGPPPEELVAGTAPATTPGPTPPSDTPAPPSQDISCSLTTIGRIVVDQVVLRPEGQDRFVPEAQRQDYHLAGGEVVRLIVDGKEQDVAGSALDDVIGIDACGKATLAAYDALRGEVDVELVAAGSTTPGEWFTLDGVRGDGSRVRYLEKQEGGRSYLVWGRRGPSPRLDPDGPEQFRADHEEVWLDTALVRSDVTVELAPGDGISAIYPAVTIEELVRQPPAGAEVTRRQFAYALASGETLGTLPG